MKGKLLFLFFCVFCLSINAQKKTPAFSINTPGSGKVNFAPWELIIYRPLSAAEKMNVTRAYLKIEFKEETGIHAQKNEVSEGTENKGADIAAGGAEEKIFWKDITYDKTIIRRSEYEWIENTKIRTETPDEFMIWLSRRNPIYTLTPYRRRLYLDAGMAMHLNIAPGKYRFSVYTPEEDTFMVPTDNKGDWISNTFEYDTENPLKVIFVWPGTDENGFYDGSWHIGWKAPQYFPPAGTYRR